MSRAFNGTTDSLTLGAGSAPPDQGPITIVVLAKAANTAGFTGWFARGRSGTSAIWSSLTSNNAGAKLFMESDFGNGVAGLTTSWAYYVVTKAAGSNLPRWHVQNVTAGTAFVHTNGSANVPDNTGPIDNVLIGQSFPGSFAVVAAIATEWNDATVEANCTLSAADLFNAVNTSGWMIRLNQASTATSVTNDAAGGGNQSAISGTSVDADDPPGYNYSISAGSTVSPTGIAVPVGIGQPTLTNSMDVVSPGGLAIPVTPGSPTLTWSGSAAPTGIAVPVTVGAPALAQLAGAVAPTGIAIPVTLGQPTVSGQPFVAPAGSPGWRALQSVLVEARQIREIDRRRGYLSCPNDGEPFRVSVDGIRYCPYDNFLPDEGPVRRNVTGRDWGGIMQAQNRAETQRVADTVFQFVACPNDGEPLSVSVDGVLFCRFDNWRPDGVTTRDPSR